MSVKLSRLHGLVRSDQESQVPNRVNPAGMLSEDHRMIALHLAISRHLLGGPKSNEVCE